jgi:hypothetical protein
MDPSLWLLLFGLFVDFFSLHMLKGILLEFLLDVGLLSNSIACCHLAYLMVVCVFDSLP